MLGDNEDYGTIVKKINLYMMKCELNAKEVSVIQKSQMN